MKESPDNQTVEAVCKNVFKDGNDRPAREAFTMKWVELINHMEKDKQRCTA